MNLIEEKLEKYFNRFVKMKDERHLNFSFALYSSITCLFGIFIGQKISGIYLFYLAFILVTAVPIIFRDEILGTKYPHQSIPTRIPTVKSKIPGKSIFEIRIQKFFSIQVIVFDL